MNQLLSRYKRDLALRGFSPRTQEHYFRNTKEFLSHYNLPPEQLDAEKIKDYLYCLITENNASDSKIRQAHGAIKYLFTQTLSRQWEIDSIPQLKKKKKLPTVFSVKEVFSLFNAGANLKHQTMLILIYSSGLRVSELPNITLTDIIKRQEKTFSQAGKRFQRPLHAFVRYLPWLSGQLLETLSSNRLSVSGKRGQKGLICSCLSACLLSG
mgnify:CR=1 FL=1